jgi:malate dehydrogenase
MVPVASRARIKGLPLETFLTEAKIAACVRDAVTGGGQVVALRKTGSATIAPALSTIEVIDHIRGARSGSVPVSVKLDGEYGIRDVVLGVPCQLGATGLLHVEEMPLTPSELAALKRAAAAIAERLKG